MQIDDEYNVRVEFNEQGKSLKSFQIRYSSLPESNHVKVGEVLLELLYLGINNQVVASIFRPFNKGDIVSGPATAKVLFSRSADFNEGDIVLTQNIVWEKYQISSDSQLLKVKVTEEQANVPLEQLEAQTALNQISQDLKGKKILINNAAQGYGPILVQQLENVTAIIKSEAQKQFLQLLSNKSTYVLKSDLAKQLKDNYHVIFDDEGGQFLDLAINKLESKGVYRLLGTHGQGVRDLFQLVMKSASLEGEKKIQQYQESSHKVYTTLYDGIDNTASALYERVNGDSIGTQIIRVTRLMEKQFQRQLKSNANPHPKL